MRHHLDLLLVNPSARAQIYQRLGEDLAAVEPPVWAGLIATFVRTQGYRVAILDAEAEGLGPDDVARRIEELNPLLCAVVVYGHQPSASTQNMVGASAVSTRIKEQTPETKLLLIGGHVSALPERTLTEEAADFVCEGEGPWTVCDLLAVLQAGGKDLSKVRGLWYRSEEGIRCTASAPLLEDLDGLMPGIAWDLL